MGEVGLISAGGTKVPSKSLEYMLVNLLEGAGADREAGLASTWAVEVCLFFIALADLTLSVSLAMSPIWATSGGTGGTRRALAD